MNYTEEAKELLREKNALIDREQERLEMMNREKEVIEQLLNRVNQQENEIEELRQDNADYEAQNKQQQNAIEQSQRECEKLRAENTELKMKANEWSKMTNRVAKETEHEDLIKVLRQYLRISRRKDIRKRGYIKMAITEIANANGLVFPDDFLRELEAFDDETPAPSTTIEAQAGAVVQISEASITNQLLEAK